MKHLMLAVPVAALFAVPALAETATTDGSIDAEGATGEVGATYGTNWPLSIGSTFFTDAELTTMRSADEISQGWQLLSQEDRDTVLAECERFMTESGASGTGDAAATDATGTETGAATAEGSTAGSGDMSTGAATGDGAVADETTVVGYDMNAMMTICPTVQGF